MSKLLRSMRERSFFRLGSPGADFVRVGGERRLIEALWAWCSGGWSGRTNVEQRLVDTDPPVVFDEAELAKAVHKEADRSGQPQWRRRAKDEQKSTDPERLVVNIG